MENDLEMMKSAKVLLEQLANGRDPISGAELPEDTILNDIQLSRCFFLAAGVLQKVIENGGQVRRVVNQKLPPFAITEEEKAAIELSVEPIQVTKFCEMINNRVDITKMSKLKVTAFGKWLLDKGFLMVDTHRNEKYKKPTELGESVGLSSELRTYGDREYYAMTYSKDAQQFILDHLDEVISISNCAQPS